MTDLTLSVVVTRGELGLGTLELNDAVAYRTVGFGPGTRVRNNVYNRSGNVHGGTLVSSRLDVIVRPLIVRVLATSATELETRTLTLIEAVEQSTYQLLETVAGRLTTYDCMTSESISPTDPSGAAQGAWDTYQLMALQHVYAIQVPTQPVPSTGAI